MTILKNLLRLVLVFFLINSIYGAYPDVEYDGNFNSNQITFNAYSGTSVKVLLNDEPIDTYLIKGDSTNILLSGVIPSFEASSGSNIDFLHNAGDDYTYNLQFINGEGDIIWSETLSGGTAQTSVNTPGNYIFRDDTTGEEKQLTITEDKISKTITLPNYAIVNGENTLTFEVEYYEDDTTQTTSTQEFTFDYEKYSNEIIVDLENDHIKTTTLDVNVSVMDNTQSYYYLINPEGDLTSCSFTQNQITPQGENTQVEITGLYEGENTISIISTNPNDCTVFTGESRFKVTVDRVAPYINLYEASLGVGSTARVIDENNFDDTVYLNENNIRLAFDSDATTFNYTLNGRGEGPLVEDQVFDQVEWIDKVEIDSTGSRLKIDIYPLEEYSTSYVAYDYDNRNREEENNNGVISLDISLDEEDTEIDFRFYEGSGPNVVEETMKIYELAYEDKGRIESATYDEEEELFIIEESLDRGRNVLRLYAYDRANNLNKKTHIIEFDDEDPEVDFNSLNPKSVFESGTSRSPYLKISGKTNKGGVEVTAFALPKDTQVFDSEGNPRSISCSNEQDHNLILRSLGQLDSSNPADSELNLDEQQITLSLGSILSRTPKVTTNADGEFDDMVVILQERNFDRGDYSNSQDNNPQVGDVSSSNELCFVTKNKFGTTNVQSTEINFDAGNTLWTPGQITLTPSTVYAAEIEQTGDNNNRVQFGVLASFTYQGDGKVTNVQGLRVNQDYDLEGSSDIQFTIKNQDLNYFYREDSNELLVYFPVEIDPLNREPLSYPEQLQLDFQADFTYDVDGSDIPIDTTNPVYFGSELNIERPLDSALWLTPQTIDDSLEFLGETINYTKQAIEWTRTLSVVGVVACTGTRLYYQSLIALEESSGEPSEERINEYKEKIYYVCDRVACSASPAACENNQDSNGFLDLNGQTTFSSADLANKEGAEFVSQGENQKTLGRITSLNVNEQSSCTTSTGESGVLVSFNVETYEEKSSAQGLWTKTQDSTEIYVRERCVEAEVTGTGNNRKVNSVNLQDYAGACYTEGAPNFDQTRCLGGQGWDPANNVIESLRCGCVTDTYSHLNNLLKVQEGIQKCLQEAKLGISSGSYCERLMSQAVCDVATNLVFSGTLGKATSRTGADGEDPHGQNVFNLLAQSNDVGNEIIDERYDGSILSEQGMSTEQIVNNICLGAATGNWDALQNSVLTSIDENQVEPILGPAFPESRIMGVNPFTGALTIQYRLTHAVVSGGQDVRTKVNFICDSSLPGGDYCPPGRSTAQELGSSIQTRTLVVREDDVSQDTIVVTDENARFRYNVLELEHEYTLDNNVQVEAVEERVMHKTNGLLGQCYWNGGVFGSNTFSQSAGITCDRLFTDDSIIEQLKLTDNSYLTPKIESGTPTYYPGNDLKLFAQYSITGRQFAQQSYPRLYYKITCDTASSNTQTSLFNYKNLDQTSGNSVYGEELISLIDGGIPQFAIPLPDGEYMIQYSGAEPLDGDEKIKARYINGNSGKTVSILNVVKGEGEIINDFSSVRFSSNEIEDGISKRLSGLSGESLSNLRFLINRDIQGEIELDIVDNDGNIIGSFTRVQPTTNVDQGRELDDLGVGACRVDTRILTPEMAQGLTEDNFNTFSPQNLNLTNVESTNIKSFNFNLARNTQNNHLFRFELIPQSKSYCVDSSSNQLLDAIELQVPIVTSNDEKLISLNGIFQDFFDISYSSNNYQLDEDFFKISSKDLKDDQLNITLEKPDSFPTDFTRDEITFYITLDEEINGNIYNHRDSVSINFVTCESEETNDEEETTEEEIEGKETI